MTKDEFLSHLRRHLRGAPSATTDEIVADYASHFDEGMAAGRGEADIAQALGDPARLARELKAEAGLKRWDEERSASAAAAAVLAILSLGAIDILILAPVLVIVIALMFAAACVACGLAVAGAVVLLASPFALIGGAFLHAALAGVGLLAAGAALGALTAAAAIALTDLLVRYGRFHLRLLRPIAA
jgi:uncharacterized membrane protein